LRGGVLSFLVVTPERLGEDFVRREEAERRNLERLIGEEKAVRDAVYRLIDESWRDDGPLPEKVIQEMLALARIERQHGRQLASIGGAVRQILDEMENNRIGEAIDLRRLAGSILEPLLHLSENILPELAAELAALRDETAGAARLRRGLALAERIEDKLLRLEKVLESMLRLETFTEIVKRLRGILQAQKESADASLRSYRREIEDIFEREPAPADGAGGAPPRQLDLEPSDGK
jgi:hypothetical protein